MDSTTQNALSEQLFQTDTNFRQLTQEHRKYENRLNELSALTYPSDAEQLEETLLKKKKLAVKDQIYNILAKHDQTIRH